MPKHVVGEDGKMRVGRKGEGCQVVGVVSVGRLNELEGAPCFGRVFVHVD